MRPQPVLAVLVLVGALAPAAFATTGDGTARRQSAIVNFERPTWVASAMLMGTYVIVHDDGRMARGEPCTVLYRVGRRTHPLDEAVSFHCIPHEGRVFRDFTTTVERNPTRCSDTLLEDQFAGDSEVHGVPIVARVTNRLRTQSPIVCVR